MSVEPSKTKGRLESLAAKYREVIVAILIFIFLDAGVLVLNFIISFRIQNDAVAVNLAGRQRMLSQRTIKALFQLEAAQRTGADPKASIEELTGAFELFDATLAAFANGGATKGGDGKPVSLPRVDDPAARASIEKALAVWIPYKERIAAVLKDPANTEELAGTLAIASGENLKLLHMMNQFTFALEQNAQGKASMLRTIQTAALVLVLINFVVIIVHVIGKLKRSDRAVQEYSENLALANTKLEATNLQLAALTAELESAKQESDTIFATVRQGLFLMDRELRIGHQISAELKAILETEHLDGRNILHLLKPLITEKQFQTVQDFFGLLMEPARRDKHLIKFNPLKRIACNFAQGEKGFSVKHLEFSFQRILGGETVERVLVTVSDVTEAVNLGAQLKAAEEKKEKQFELLLGILHVDPAALEVFIRQVNTEIAAINAILREQETMDSSSRLARAKLDGVFRCIHNVKGNAAFLGLDPIQKLAHRMEDKLKQLRDSAGVTGKDFLPVVVDLAELQTTLDELTELLARLAGLRNHLGAPAQPSRPAAQLASAIESLAADLAGRLGKKVRFECSMEGYDDLAAESRNLVKDALIQLVRNSLVYGIESPGDREKLGKRVEGLIRVQTQKTRNGSEHFVLDYRDDGAGLQLDRIRSRLVESGLVNADHAEDLSPEELCGYIFEPGFTTSDDPTEDAGRGVGLDLIKSKVVDDLGGEIRFDFIPRQYCAFTISLPV